MLYCTEMKKILLLAFSAILLFSIACKTHVITAPKPPNVALVTPPKPLSVIGIPFHVSTVGLATSLNKKFTTEIYKDDNLDDNIKLTILKRTDLLVNTSNNNLTITAPLHIDFVYNLKVFGGFEKPIAQSFNVTVNFTTNPSIDRDWNLNLNSKGKISWDDLPVINLGLTSINLPELFGNIIQGQVNKMASKIDQEIPKSLNIKKMMDTTWKNLANPFALDSAFNAWLLINPKNIYITPITYTQDEMLVKLGVSSLIDVVSGYKPTNDSFSNVLPPLRQVNTLNDQLKINLSASVSFEQINAKINEQFKDKPMLLEGAEYSINIKDAKAFAYGNKMMIAIDLDGKVKKGVLGKGIKGIVYATGTPSYNSTKKTIEIKQFDFDIKTRDILVKSASWLLNSNKFRENIEKQLVFDIGPQLVEAKKTANEALTKKWVENIDINGEISKIEPGNFFITPNALNLNIITEGNLKLIMTGF